MTDFNQKTHDTDVGSHGGKSRQMMEVFENQEFGSIRVLQEAGKTFFCASDVAKALGYVNPYAAVKRHCRDPLTKREGVVQKVNQYGDAGEQVVEISFITEGDVYRLIVHSKLPSAERFEHWVFDEVLPSIRKHGVYMSDSILDQVIQHPEVIYTLAQELVAEREQLEGIRKQLDAAQPKADYFDTFVNSEDCTCIRNFCKEIGIPEKTAVALLLDHRYLYRSPSGWLMPFADKSARGYFIVRDCYGRSGKLVQQTRVTCKGKNHLFNQNNAVCSMDCKNCPNGASQPNPMDDSMFEKSIAMLHNWVMLEAIREDHPKERIVMVILPGAGGELLTEAGSRDIFEDVYDEMEADLVADGELLLHYDKSDVIETDRTRYLLGAAEVSEIDQNGNECSINLFTLERTIDYVNENLTVVSIGGELVSALRLI